jgi:hypothetical protein
MPVLIGLSADCPEGLARATKKFYGVHFMTCTHGRETRARKVVQFLFPSFWPLQRQLDSRAGRAQHEISYCIDVVADEELIIVDLDQLIL